MQTLILQIIEQQIEFKIFHLIPLDYRLLYEVLAASCSFFIVLLQVELDV